MRNNTPDGFAVYGILFLATIFFIPAPSLALSNSEITAVTAFIRNNPISTFRGVDPSLACEASDLASIISCNANSSIIQMYATWQALLSASNVILF